MAIHLAQNQNVDKIKDNQPSKETPSTGTLKTDGKDYEVFQYKNTGEVTAGVSEFLSEVNSAPVPTEVDFQATLELEQQIAEMQSELAGEEGKNLSPEKQATGQTKQHPSQVQTKPSMTPQLPGQSRFESRDRPMPPKNSSIFSLAREFSKPAASKTLDDTRQKESETQKDTSRAKLSTDLWKPESESLASNKSEERGDREKEKEREGNDRDGQSGQQQEQQHKKGAKAKSGIVGKVQCSSDSKKRSVATSHESSEGRRAEKSEQNQGSGDIFYRFMALMARILGQAEAEAHDLYQRIKSRTDDIDTLTLLMSKINSANGAIDWSNNDEMKQLLAKARKIGVDIPADRFKWTEEEKKLFKENIQMKKDSMEKVTQLERTDMQRYLQEASQCHQARSNVLKLMKEVTDTIIANMRP